MLNFKLRELSEQEQADLAIRKEKKCRMLEKIVKKKT